MTDPLNDPRFPKRPDTPDFWRISEILLQHDGQATEGGLTLNDIIHDTVDHPTLSYVALQRAGLLIRATGLPDTAEMRTALASSWLDAFLAGAQFEKRGGHRPTTP